MRTALVAILFTLVSVSAVQAQGPPVVGVGHFFSWDYANTDLTAGAVERFELRLDGGEWTSVGINPSTDGGTLSGHTSYRAPVPSLTPGTHAWAVRACNALACGPETSGPAFTFTIVPLPPANLRITIVTAPK